MKGTLIHIVGDPKTGKTVSACTFPKPLKILDFDAGVTSAYHAKDEKGNLVVSDADGISVEEFYVNDYVDLSFTTPKKADYARNKPPEYTEQSIAIINKYQTVMREIFEKEGDGIQTLVIDPLTQMFRLWGDCVMWQNKTPQLQLGDYRTLEGMFYRQFIPALKAMNRWIPWIILVNHENSDQDGENGPVLQFPMGTSRPMAKTMSEAFDESWRQVVDGKKHMWRTKNHGRFSGCGSRHDLPDKIEAHFRVLETYLKKEG